MFILGYGPNTELQRTLNKYGNQKDLLKRKLLEFVTFKLAEPHNGMIPGVSRGYGSSDRKFKPNGKFAKELPGTAHAHLTHDISVVYRIDSEANTFTIFGLYTHDAIGTGSPENIARQGSMASRWAGMDYNLGTGIDSDEFEREKSKLLAPEPTGKFTAGPSGKVDYTPKKKPEPTRAQQTQQKLQDPLEAGVDIVNSRWEQRNLKNRMADAKTMQEKLAILNAELVNLTNVKRKHSLHPNQSEYEKGLVTLLNFLTAQQRGRLHEESDDEIGLFPDE